MRHFLRLWSRRVGNGEDFLLLETLDSHKTKRYVKRTHISSLTDTCYENLFSYLNGSDLKSCRYVCRQWKDYIDDILGTKTQISFRGVRSLFYFGKKCSGYLKKYDTQFSLWTSLQMSQIWRNQIELLLNVTEFSIAVHHITALELRYCVLTWMNLVNILKSFPSLENLKLIKTTYYYHAMVREDMMRLWEREDEITAQYGKFWPTFPQDEEGKYCQKIKDIYVEEHANIFIQQALCLPRRCSAEVLSILQNLNVKCEKLHFCLELQDWLTTTNEQHAFWLQLTTFLRTCSNIKVLTLEASELSDHLSFSSFLLSNARSYTPASNLATLQELYLTFPRLNIENMFITELLEFKTFIEGLVSLKVLEIGTFIFASDSSQFFQDLVPKQNSCVLRIGISLSDKFGTIAAKNSIEKITDPFFQKIIKEIDLLVYEKVCLVDLQSMLPITYNLNGNYELGEKYSEVTKFQVRFTNAEVRPNFRSFNIDILTELFPNLTSLTLTSGPLTTMDYRKFLKSRAVIKAVINDYDIRLIMQNLVKLKKLHLWANLEKVTDFGITGRMCQISKECDVGHSFSNLKDLQELSLRGLGKKITDLSALYGFNDLSNLKFLELIGNHKISAKGKKFLRKLPPEKYCRFKISLNCVALSSLAN